MSEDATGDGMSQERDTPELDRIWNAYRTAHLAARPGLRLALREDARKFAAHRMEPVFDGGPRLWLDMLRLAWQSEDFLGLALYRLRMALSRAGVPLLPRLINKVCMWFFGIRIGTYPVIREGVYFPHGNVVIDGAVYVGRGCEICPWVTMGLVQGVVVGPTLEDNVYVGTGAKILGPVRIGEGARVGAGAVVLRDVPPYATVVGAPAKVVDEDWRLKGAERSWAALRESEIVFGHADDA